MTGNYSPGMVSPWLHSNYTMRLCLPNHVMSMLKKGNGKGSLAIYQNPAQKAFI